MRSRRRGLFTARPTGAASRAAALGLTDAFAQAPAADRGQGRADRAALGHLRPPRRSDAHGRRDGHRAHQRAGRRQGARRRQAQARRARLRRHHRESQERRAAHGGAGNRPGRGHRLLSELVHARRHRGDGARAPADAHFVLFGPASPSAASSTSSRPRRPPARKPSSRCR